MTLGMPTTTHPGDELRDSAIRQLGMAAKALNLDPGMHKYLATPERTLIVLPGMGHLGEVEVAGSALRGMAVHIASRIGGLAAPGEVLVSSTVKDLVAGAGFTFIDRGSHELKGVPEMKQIFAVA